jgi:hypothetical protein
VRRERVIACRKVENGERYGEEGQIKGEMKRKRV